MRAYLLFALALASIAACSGDDNLQNGTMDASVADAGSDAIVVTSDARPPLEAAPGCPQPDPANFDVPGNRCDDDGNGAIDDVPICDDVLVVTGDATQFAKALDACSRVTSVAFRGAWSTGNAASDMQHGILSGFGDVIRAQQGVSLGILSTGWARLYDDGATAKTTFKGGVAAQVGNAIVDAPPGFPQAAPGCPLPSSVHDVIDLHLVLQVPNNAMGVSFDYDLWSGAWPEHACSGTDDQFVALIDGHAVTSLTVNDAFVDRCTPGTPTHCAVSDASPNVSSCGAGEAELGGTGFGAPKGTFCATPSTPGASSGWLTTTAPVTPGSTVTIDFVLWDGGDAFDDSSVLLDRLQWLAAPTTAGTQRPPH